MLDDLKKIGLEDSFCDQMIDEFGYDLALNVACNYELVKTNIETLKRFGITNIEQLILKKIDIFLMDNEQLVKRFGKYNIPVAAKLINEDYTFIDDLV